MRAVLVAFLLVGCVHTEAAQPGPPVSQPAPPPPPAVPVEAEQLPQDAAPPAEHDPPLEAAEARQDMGGCLARPSERDACRSQGRSCTLDSAPEVPPPSPCANRGARCLEETISRSPMGPCMCTCSPEYIQRRREVDQALAARRNERYEAEGRSYAAEQKAYEDCQAQQAAKAKKHPGRPIPKCAPPDRQREPQLPQ